MLEVIRFNKKMQKIININLDDYKVFNRTFTSIEIEIKPSDIYGKFLNVQNKKQEGYYHVYFNDSLEETKRKYDLNEKDKVSKIKIKIDYQVQSFDKLFFMCDGIEAINFKKFYRNNIKDMSDMFYECTTLKEINLSNVISDNVTDMSYMFHGCSSLKEINLSNFNTKSVTDINGIFSGCSSLKRINISNFNTENITDMN